MKGLLLLAMLGGALPAAAPACTVWTVPSKDQAARASDLVVEGMGQFPGKAGEGTIDPARTLRGKAPRVVTVTGTETAARTAALCAPPVLIKGAHRGIFYLAKLKSGRYQILLFEERARS